MTANADTAPRYRVGTASWTDPTLLASGFYPPSAGSAEARLRFYAAHFDTVEVDSSYYALPSEHNAQLWAQRTPDNFQFHIKAFAALTQHAAETRALPQAFKRELSAEALRQPRLSIPPGPLLDLSFRLFFDALRPLRDAGKLGCILLQFPPWFTATPTNQRYVESCQERLPGDRLAIEFRHRSWFESRTEQTLQFLREHDLALVCLDAPSAPGIAQPPFELTSSVAYVRLHGRNRDAWFGKHASAADRFKYLYSDAELHECAARIGGLRGAQTINVIFNNCYADYGIKNATTMQKILPVNWD